jgi:hypothetical protein
VKKIFGLLFSILLLSTILISPNSAKANYNIDNKCAYVDTTNQNVDNSGGYYQTFYPKENRITSAVLMLGALGGNATATLKIMDNTGNVLVQQSMTVTGVVWPPVTPAPFSFDNFSPLTVTPGQMYKLVLLRSSGPSLYWYTTTTCDVQGNGYANGASFPGMDYVFTTYGYTVPTPTPTPTTQIAAPTNAAATYSSSTKKVKVSWDKSSTADIDGYNIYRSENQTNSFAKIGQTDSKTQEYQDANIVAQKNYSYYIKAYKGSNESAQSNTASVTTPNTLTPISSIATNQTNWFFYLLFGGVGLLLIIFLIVYELKLKKLWAEKGKKLF